MNQHRGIHELYKVIHDVPGEGAPGSWIDRRVTYINPGRMNDAITAQIECPFGVPGMSFRLLRPRTGDDRDNILVREFGFGSLVAFDEAVAAFVGGPGSVEWRNKWHWQQLKTRMIQELYRVVG